MKEGHREKEGSRKKERWTGKGNRRRGNNKVREGGECVLRESGARLLVVN